MPDKELLFTKYDLMLVIQRHQEEVEKEVAKIDPDGLLNTPVEDLASYIEEKYRLDADDPR